VLNLNERLSARSRVPIAALAFVASIVATKALAQGVDGPNQKSFQEFEMSVTEGIVNRPLPFDVQFIMTGRIPAEVHAVRAYLTKPPVPGFPATNPQPVRRISCEGISWDTSNEIGLWTKPPERLVTTPVATPRFRILFPALEVNTNYCTRFELQREVSASEAEAFRRAAFAAIDQELRRVEFQQRNFSNEDVESLRLRLIAAVRATNSTIYAKPGTIFDPTASGDNLLKAQQELVTRITPALEPQFQRFLQLEQYQRLTTAAQAALNGLRAAANTTSLLRRDAFVNTLDTADQNTLKQIIDGTPAAVATMLGGDNTLATIWETERAQPCTVPQAETLLTTLRTNALFLTRLFQKVKVVADAAAAADKAAAAAAVKTAAAAEAASKAAAAATLKAAAPAATAADKAAEAAAEKAALAAAAVAAADRAAAAAAATERAQADTLLGLVTAAGSAIGGAVVNIEGVPVPPAAGAAPGAAPVRTAGIRDTLCARALAINVVAMALRTVAKDEVTLIVTTTGDFASRHPWHFGVDVGLAVAPVIGEVFPYVGVNMYFRPVNRNAKLSSLSEEYGHPVNTFTRRFSLMLGYTWTDNLLKTNKRVGLFNRDQAIGQSVENEQADAMLVAGAGLRVNDVLRIAAGALVFKAVKTNPLLTDTDLKVTPFFSLSWDWDAVGDIRGLGGLMGFGNSPIPVAVTQRDPPPAPPAPESEPAAGEAAVPAPATPAPAAPAVAPAPAPPGK
jgi:hypothetical protein